MNDYITLLGTDDVYRAGSMMQSAATDMKNAAAWTEESLQRHRLFMDDWLMRFEEILARLHQPTIVSKDIDLQTKHKPLRA